MKFSLGEHLFYTLSDISEVVSANNCRLTVLINKLNTKIQISVR